MSDHRGVPDLLIDSTDGALPPRAERTGDKGPGEVFIYQPAEEKVYSKDDLTGLQDFLESLQAKHAVSQVDLEEGLEKHGRMTPMPRS